MEDQKEKLKVDEIVDKFFEKEEDDENLDMKVIKIQKNENKNIIKTNDNKKEKEDEILFLVPEEKTDEHELVIIHENMELRINTKIINEKNMEYCALCNEKIERGKVNVCKKCDIKIFDGMFDDPAVKTCEIIVKY